MASRSYLRTFLDEGSLTALLKEHGFTRSRGTWTRSRGDALQFVHFHVASFSERGTCLFTVELGIVLMAAWRAYGEGVREPSLQMCFPSFRIGQAVAGIDRKGPDLWWTVGESIDATGIATELKAHMLAHVLPLMDRLDSVAAVFHFIQHEASRMRDLSAYTSIMSGIICWLHGDQRLAESTFDDLEQNPRFGEDWRQRWRDVRQRLLASSS